MIKAETTPGGSAGQVQFNDGAAGFAGAAGFICSADAAQVTITSQAPANVPLTLRAAPGQTGDLLKAYNASGVLLFALTADLHLRMYDANSSSLYTELYSSTSGTQSIVHLVAHDANEQAGAISGKLVSYSYGGHSFFQPESGGSAGCTICSYGAWQSAAPAYKPASCTIDTELEITVAGAKMLSLRNAGTELAHVTKEANFFGTSFVGAIATQTADYTLTATDHTILADASAGAVTLTLPSASDAGAGRSYAVKKIDSSANAVTLAAATGETIDGGTGAILSAAYQVVAVTSDGADWWITETHSANGAQVSLDKDLRSFLVESLESAAGSQDALDTDFTAYLSGSLSGIPVQQNKLAEDYTTSPAVVFFRRDSDSPLFLNGDDGLATTLYDVEVYGTDIDDVETTAKTLKDALNGKSGAMGDSVVLGVFVSDHASDYVPKSELATDEGLDTSTFAVEIIH